MSRGVARSPSVWLRFLINSVQIDKISYLFLVVCLVIVPFAQAAEVGMLDDFGRPDIHVQYLNLGDPSGSTIAGIHQQGQANAALIDQSGGSDNVAMIWQLGNQSRAYITQAGSFNEIRLSQTGNLLQADLVQTGNGNQMAIQMLGSSSSVTGEQVGNDNRAVAVIADEASLTFYQSGNAHVLEIDVGTGMSVTVVQP